MKLQTKIILRLLQDGITTKDEICQLFKISKGYLYILAWKNKGADISPGAKIRKTPRKDLESKVWTPQDYEKWAYLFKTDPRYGIPYDIRDDDQLKLFKKDSGKSWKAVSVKIMEIYKRVGYTGQKNQILILNSDGNLTMEMKDENATTATATA